MRAPKAGPAARRSGSCSMMALTGREALPIEMLSPRLHLQLIENASIHRKAALFHRSKPAAFFKGHRPVERIGGIDRLQIDKRLRAAVRLAGHRPHGGDLAHVAERSEIGKLVRVRLPMHKGRLDISAKQHRTLASKQVLDRIRQAVDRADGSCAERDAEQENREPRKTAA